MALEQFNTQYGRFQRLISANDKGHAFTNFNEGVAAAWEGYKPRLRNHALRQLNLQDWTPEMIGSGEILKRVIAAIEVQDSSINLTNNVVFWQNRYGHANRDHRVLLEAVRDPPLMRECENTLFRLYKGGQAEEGAIFEELSELTARKYPLLAYLFFVKDMDRFMPIQPTTFDRVFRELGIGLRTLRNCSWSNYRQYISALEEVRSELSALPALAGVRLVDAHSFCWLLAKLEDDGVNSTSSGKKDAGRILSARQKAVVEMRKSIEQTVAHSNGQTVERTVKNKETSLNTVGLDELLGLLLDRQENRCALTGIPFRFGDADIDKALLPSPDRIDSDGHYTPDNVQIVCRFVNSWKGASPNDEFRRLLMIVRGLEEQG